MATEEITIKELFERLVIMETKLTALGNESRKTKRLFQIYVFLMVILLITNILIHAVGMFL